VKRRPRVIKTIFYAFFVASVIGASVFLYLEYLKRTPEVTIAAQFSNYQSSLELEETHQDVTINKLYTEEIPAGWELLSIDLPTYVELDGNTLKFSPKKEHYGVLKLLFAPKDNPHAGRRVRAYNIGLPSVDFEKLRNEVLAIMGDNANYMGVYLEDIVRGEKMTINEFALFKPGSISKLPVGIITILDFQNGTRKLTDTYAVQNSLKHSSADAIGRLPQGTKVQLKQYVDELFKVSSNTAQYHLRTMLGGTGVMHERTHKELGVANFYEDPHEATPNSVGKVLNDIYFGRTLKGEWRDFFYNTLGAAAPSLRDAIPAGIPKDVRVVNKVGFLFGKGDTTYSDAATVFAKHTDYILVVFNNRAPQFPQGSKIIKEISAKIYSAIDTN
jgi:beta-lactamase class A